MGRWLMDEGSYLLHSGVLWMCIVIPTNYHRFPSLIVFAKTDVIPSAYKKLKFFIRKSNFPLTCATGAVWLVAGVFLVTLG